MRRSRPMVIAGGRGGREGKTAPGQLRDLVTPFDGGFDLEDVCLVGG